MWSTGIDHLSRRIESAIRDRNETSFRLTFSVLVGLESDFGALFDCRSRRAICV
jgi:hypothetical protein